MYAKLAPPTKRNTAASCAQIPLSMRYITVFHATLTLLSLLTTALLAAYPSYILCSYVARCSPFALCPLFVRPSRPLFVLVLALGSYGSELNPELRTRSAPLWDHVLSASASPFVVCNSQVSFDFLPLKLKVQCVLHYRIIYVFCRGAPEEISFFQASVLFFFLKNASRFLLKCIVSTFVDGAEEGVFH